MRDYEKMFTLLFALGKFHKIFHFDFAVAAKESEDTSDGNLFISTDIMSRVQLTGSFST